MESIDRIGDFYQLDTLYKWHAYENEDHTKVLVSVREVGTLHRIIMALDIKPFRIYTTLGMVERSVVHRLMTFVPMWIERQDVTEDMTPNVVEHA